MPPFRGQPGVVEVKPANRAADVPCRLDGIQLELRTRYAGTVRYHGARYDGPQVLGTLREAQRKEAASQGIHQAVARGVVGFVAEDIRARDVIGDGDEFRVRVGPDVQLHVAHGERSASGV